MFEKGQLEFQGLPTPMIESQISLFYRGDLWTAKVAKRSREDFANILLSLKVWNLAESPSNHAWVIPQGNCPSQALLSGVVSAY